MSALTDVATDDTENIRHLNLKLIRTDGGTQSRVRLNPDVVADYAAVIRDGVDFPPVVVFHDGSDYWLADGFHRFHGYRDAGAVEIDAKIRTGTKRDAVLYSVGANAQHGLQRTNEDKRKSVLTLLADPVWAAWADRAIGRQCAVDHKTVARIRSEYLGNSPDSKTVERGGTIYQQSTTKIGTGKTATVADMEPAEVVDTRKAEQAEHDRQRDEHRASLPPAIQAMEAAKAEARKAKSEPDADRVEQLEAEIVELQAANADLKDELAALQADNTKWDEMRVAFEAGGFEAVVALKEEVIRVQASRIEGESADKASWAKQAKFWRNEAVKLGFSRDVVIDAKTGEVSNG